MKEEAAPEGGGIEIAPEPEPKRPASLFARGVVGAGVFTGKVIQKVAIGVAGFAIGVVGGFMDLDKPNEEES